MTRSVRSPGEADSDAGGAPGRRLSYWIAQTLRRKREAAGIPKSMVSTVIDSDPATIDRLEKGTAYGRDIDRAVAAYAYLLGVDDPRELWAEAINLWYAEGAAPDFTEDLPGVRFVRPIREEAQRQRQSRDARSETQSSRASRREAR